MKICSNCVLPETFPGIRFNSEGVCNYCQAHEKRKRNVGEVKERYKKKFISVINELNKPNQPNQLRSGAYEVLMAYSGGKDSTYTLWMLKEDFSLNVLAVTFDHGFVSGRALENIRKVTEALNVDHITIRPKRETLRRVFVRAINGDDFPMKALERASSICNTCMNLVKSFLTKTAIEMRVPIVAYGWSPGQAPVQSSVLRTNPSMIRLMQQATKRTLSEEDQAELQVFFIDEGFFSALEQKPSPPFPYFVNPLAFMDYDEQKIYERIKELGWIAPEDTDANSTNCLLNAFANEVHLQKYGFHPYALEVATLVREGHMGREEGLKKLSARSDLGIVGYVRERLGVERVE